MYSARAVPSKKGIGQGGPSASFEGGGRIVRRDKFNNTTTPHGDTLKKYDFYLKHFKCSR